MIACAICHHAQAAANGALLEGASVRHGADPQRRKAVHERLGAQVLLEAGFRHAATDV